MLQMLYVIDMMSAIFCKHKHSKDKCDDLLWNRIHKTGHVYEKKIGNY